MNVIISPNPLLHEISAPVEVGDKSIKKLVKQMAKTMYKQDGVGLAAVQVGVLKRVIVMDCDYVRLDEDDNYLPKNLIVMINPEIVCHSENKIACGEGCLSVPGINVDIKRYKEVEVKAMDENFQEFTIKASAKDLLGRCIQHEMDHLDGITILDSAEGAAKFQALQDYDNYLEENGLK
ncbi:MAG: peptide deformylase [Clostridia bacterium]|nr:peptide deformylase [Clostridia bacterium]